MDITPALGIGLAGAGPITNAAQGMYGRLFANLLLLQDAIGTRMLLITADLFAGSRYLHEAMGIALADEGLTTDRILIAGSHSHRSPSSILGSLTFDRLSGPAWVREPWEAHFDQPTADAMVDQLVAGVRGILGPIERTPDRVTLRAAELALTGPRLWGSSVNRSPSAMDGLLSGIDPEQILWGDPAELTPAERDQLARRFNHSDPPAWLGGEAPPNTPLFERGPLDAAPVRPVRIDPPTGAVTTGSEESLDQVLRGILRKGKIVPGLKILVGPKGPSRPMNNGPLDVKLVDARLHLLLAREPGGTMIGGFGLFGATPSLIGGSHGVFTPDANGVASMLARTRLRTAVPVGIGGGAVGDVNLVPRGTALLDIRKNGKKLEDAASMVQEAAEALAEALVDSMESASLDWVADLVLEPGFIEVSPTALGLDPVGRESGATLAGSELAGSPLRCVLKEGRRSKEVSPPVQQSPKSELNPFEGPPDLWPLRAFRLVRPGGTWWSVLGMPLECSTELASELQVVVGRGQFPVSVASPCGGFAGYANDRWGYAAQAYEGSMNLHGRFTGDALLSTFRAGLPDGPLAMDAVFSSDLGALPLRLGSHKERSTSKPNALSGSIALKAGRFKTFGRVRRPQLEVTLGSGTVTVLAVVEGRAPTGPMWTGPLVAIGRVNAGRTRVIPLTFGEVKATDVEYPFLIWADVRTSETRWRIQVTLPSTRGRLGLVLYSGITGGAVQYLDANGLF